MLGLGGYGCRFVWDSKLRQTASCGEDFGSSRTIPHRLTLSGRNGYERLETSHVIRRRLGKRLSKAYRAPFGLSLLSIRGIGNAVVVELLVLAVDRMWPVHDRRLRCGFLLLDWRSRRV